ncbi:MAG: hypothetical protein AB9834_08195 [Lentimicrobium sp.]
MKSLFAVLALLAVIPAVAQEKALYQSEKFSIYGNRVEQPPYKAVALSSTHLISDYQSPANLIYSADIQFKFSLNSRDNEMLSGFDHLVTLHPENNNADTGPVVFGRRFIDTTGNSTALPENVTWLVKLDMRHVLAAFEKEGYFTLFNGQKFYKADFKGVYIAGSAKPLSWDFENLYTVPDWELKDPDGDGIYTTTLLLNPHQDIKGPDEWKLNADLKGLPEFRSGNLLSEALYKLSLEEMLNDIRPDGAFMAGKEWEGVWTRDISYSIHLALAILKPGTAKQSLMRKVKNKRIIQDTGSGGSWPVSTDRVVWAVAAWEIYKVTGDREWLSESYEIIKNTWEDDRKTAFDTQSGLYYGESSFLDWREQTYPKWMEPVHIFQSVNLGTNTIHYQVCNILAEMAEILGQLEEQYREASEELSIAINKELWMEDKGYYAQYAYGNYFRILSPRSESLGEALSILWGIAGKERAEKMVASVPVTAFGIPCIYPQIPHIKPYHNDAVWPFVQAYWALASAKTGNEESVLQSIAAIYRQASLFLTNKENFVATNGDFKGTAINSDRQLWSVAANLAIVYKIYFGMEFKPDGLMFSPFVPASMSGVKELKGFIYRDAVLDISISGSGNSIRSFTLDGLECQPFIPGNLIGNHKIEIFLEDNNAHSTTVNLQEVRYSLPAPLYRLVGDSLFISSVDGQHKFNIYRNGKKWLETSDGRIQLPADSFYTEYMISVTDEAGYESFAALPVIRYLPVNVIVLEAETFAQASIHPCKGFTGPGFVELTTTENTRFAFTVPVKSGGEYLISFRYSNGSGPVNTDNKCAIRTLMVNGAETGTVVMPQRGLGEWSNWGSGNSLKVHLSPGNNEFSLELLNPQNANMNGEINTAFLDSISVIRLE